MVKLSDIANRLGLSVTTVSYSLNDDPRIPDVTKQRVIDAAAELGYAGKNRQRPKNDYYKQVVLCINSLTGAIYNEIATTMRDTLKLNNCELMIYLGSDITRIKWLDGLIILNSKVSNDDIYKITARKVPVILMDRDTEIYGALNITLDNFNGCKAATQCAIDAGAKNFAFVGGPKESYESMYRYNGFCDALEKNNLSTDGMLVLQTDFTFDSGLNACRFILEHNPDIDSIVCANDETAMGIFAGLKAENIQKEIIVAGFDGINKYALPHKFITAKANHKHWATTSSYAMLQLFKNVSGLTFKKIPVNVVEYNL